MPKEQSSITWFINQLPIRIINSYQEEIQKAILMHKQEIVKAFDSGDFMHHYKRYIDKDGHEYYQETYGNK